MKNYLVLVICIIPFCLMMGSISISESAVVNFTIASGYQMELGQEYFTNSESFKKAIYVPAGAEVECNVSGSGSIEISDKLRLRDIDLVVLTAEIEEDFSVDDKLQIAVSYAGAAEEFQAAMCGSFKRMYEALFPELTETAGWRDIEELQPSILFVYPETDNTSFWQAYDYLKEWKAQKGYLIYEYELPASAGTGILKNYIQDAYDNWDIPPEYVCLLGDAGGDYNIPAYYWETGESDHYYSTLAGDDELSDLHIGRLSFNTINELQTIVYKIINYERNPYLDNTSWFSRALLTGDPTSSGQSCVYTNINIRELIENNHPEYDYMEVYEAPFVNQMLTAVNLGVSYFNYRGFWGMSSWYQGTAQSLNNGMMLPFVVISTCGTGDFAGSGACRSESFIRAGSVSNPRGGIGAVGTATTATHTCFNNCYAMGTAYGLFAEDLRTMGAAHTRGKTSLWLNYPQNPDDASIRFSHWNNLMGDPSGEIWVGVPQELNVDCVEVYARSQEILRIRAMDQYGNGIEGLYGCVYNTEHDEQHFNWSNAEGYCTFYIDELDSDEYMLSVSGRNYYPFQQEIEIVDSNDLEISDLEFIDENLTGSFEPDETGVINFTLSNNSGVSYENILVEIGSNDSNIQVEESMTIAIMTAGENLSINDIPVHYSGSGTEAFDQYISISLTNNNMNLEDYYLFPVSEIQLEISGYQFSDDNNNQPEPGENVYLSYELTNIGAEDLDNVALEIVSSSNLIVLTDNTQFPGNIGTNEIYSSAIPVMLQILPEYIGGNEAALYFRLTNESGYEQELEMLFTVGTTSSSEPTGPDEYGYCIYDTSDSEYQSVEYNWIEINTEEELSLPDSGDMGSVCQVELPFTLRFYDQDYDQLSVCSNGWAAPGYTESASFMNWTIPGEGGISPIIAVFWDDLVNSNGGIYTYYAEPEHCFIIEWDNLLNDWDNSVETFELIIYDREYYPASNGNNQMKFQYKDFNNTNQGSYSGYHNGNHGQFATIGIEDQSGTCGVQYTFNNSYPETGSELTDQSALMIGGMPIPEECPWILVSDVQYYNAAGSQTISPGDFVEVLLDLQNIGSENSGNLEVTFSSEDIRNIEIIDGNIGYITIAAGETAAGISGLNFVLSENCSPVQLLHFQLEITNNEMTWNYPVSHLLITPRIDFSENPLNLGEVMCGFTMEHILEIRNRGTADLEILSIESSSQELSFDFEPLLIEPGGGESLLINYLSSQVGEISESLAVCSNDLIDSLLIIPVVGVSVLPPEINIDTSIHHIQVEENSIYNYALTLENTGEGALQIEASLSGYSNSQLGAKFGGGHLNLSYPIITGEEFTIEAWVRMDGSGFHTHPANPIFSQRDNETGGIRAAVGFFSSSVSGDTKLGVSGADTPGLIIVTEAPPQGEWHHYAAVVSTETAQIYIDGELRVAEINLESGGYTNNVAHVTVGAHKFSGSVKSSLDGMMDEVRIWNRALSDNELNYYMNRSRDPESECLAAYWTFNSAGDWQDISNSNLIVTPVDEVWQEDSAAGIRDWIEIENSSITVNGGAEAAINLIIDSSWLPDLYEEYTIDFILSTNDPLLPEVTIPFIVQLVPSEEDNNTIIAQNCLQQNYPNPFYCGSQRNNILNIEYSLAEDISAAEVVIYNIKGQKITSLEIDVTETRNGKVIWDGRNSKGNPAASGVYCYTLKADGKNVCSKKLVLLR
ncbi:MAG: T9SS type A sorting domain-containing protein [Candidatus Cloacimonetes bacterium]|nr:T9SS type A sorting domain-containing protein [Candidatus Cloacimonadota bacterium]